MHHPSPTSPPPPFTPPPLSPPTPPTHTWSHRTRSARWTSSTPPPPSPPPPTHLHTHSCTGQAAPGGPVQHLPLQLCLSHLNPGWGGGPQPHGWVGGGGGGWLCVCGWVGGRLYVDRGHCVRGAPSLARSPCNFIRLTHTDPPLPAANKVCIMDPPPLTPPVTPPPYPPPYPPHPLPAANKVCIMDPSWNPAADAQVG